MILFCPVKLRYSVSSLIFCINVIFFSQKCSFVVLGELVLNSTMQHLNTPKFRLLSLTCMIVITCVSNFQSSVYLSYHYLSTIFLTMHTVYKYSFFCYLLHFALCVEKWLKLIQCDQIKLTFFSLCLSLFRVATQQRLFSRYIVTL